MLADNCQKYIPGFCELLQNVDFKSISSNRYCQNYLQHLLTHKNYYEDVTIYETQHKKDKEKKQEKKK